MAEETEQTEQVQEAVALAEQAVAETQTTETEKPHPLQPGGARFEEVYARMRQAEDRAARMEGALQQAQQQQ